MILAAGVISMNIIVELARSHKNDQPDDQHKSNRYDDSHLILPRRGIFWSVIASPRLAQSIARRVQSFIPIDRAAPGL
jgi:hypothetical protein